MARFSPLALLAALLTSLPGAPVVVYYVRADLGHAEWNVHPVRLPTPLSDHSATILTIDGKKMIVLAGGCDSPEGNAFVDAAGVEGEMDYFACASLSKAVWAFVPGDSSDSEGDGVGEDGDGTWKQLPDMPRERYRHGAVVESMGGKLILVGGRTLFDDMIPEIDVYNPVTNTWFTPASLPESHQTADNAAFLNADSSYLYVAGGYVGPTYDSLDRVIRIDLSQLLAPTPFYDTRSAASLGTKRGDVHAVVSSDTKYVYITGGFNHLNDFCAPLVSTERYEFNEDAWTTVAPLEHGRGDKALVLLKDKVYAIGGESRPDDWCVDKDGGNLVRDQSAVLDDVEVFDPEAAGDGDGKGAWSHVHDIPNARFRFAAAAWEEHNSIYIFGGQEPLDAECNCHRTSDIVATIDFDDDVGARSAAAKGAPILASIVGAVAGVAYGGALMFL